MIVIGIDIGLVNLAYSSYNTIDKRLCVDNISLIENFKYNEGVIPYLVQIFIEERRALFLESSLVLIESQMKVRTG